MELFDKKKKNVHTNIFLVAYILKLFHTFIYLIGIK